MDRLLDELRELASRKGGVILASDLRGLRMEDAERAAAVRRLFRLRRGAYAPDPPVDAAARHRLTIAAVLRQLARGGGNVAASHISAALLHGLPVPPGALSTVHVLVSSTGVRRGVRHGVHTHAATSRGGANPEFGTTTIGGLAVTDPVTTVLACARTLPVVEAVAIADAALNREMVQLQALERASAAGRGLPGSATGRRVLALADAGSESVGETRTRLILVQAGFELESQVELREPDGTFVARVDLKVRDAPVVVEFDGRAKYTLQGSPESAHWREKVRHDRIGNLGYERVRVWWNRLADPGAIVTDVARACERAGRNRREA